MIFYEHNNLWKKTFVLLDEIVLVRNVKYYTDYFSIFFLFFFFVSELKL